MIAFGVDLKILNPQTVSMDVPLALTKVVPADRDTKTVRRAKQDQLGMKTSTCVRFASNPTPIVLGWMRFHSSIARHGPRGVVSDDCEVCLVLRKDSVEPLVLGRHKGRNECWRTIRQDYIVNGNVAILEHFTRIKSIAINCRSCKCSKRQGRILLLLMLLLGAAASAFPAIHTSIRHYCHHAKEQPPKHLYYVSLISCNNESWQCTDLFCVLYRNCI